MGGKIAHETLGQLLPDASPMYHAEEEEDWLFQDGGYKKRNATATSSTERFSNEVPSPLVFAAV